MKQGTKRKGAQRLFWAKNHDKRISQNPSSNRADFEFLDADGGKIFPCTLKRNSPKKLPR